MFVKSFWIWVLYTSLLVTVRLNAENSCTDQPPHNNITCIKETKLNILQ